MPHCGSTKGVRLGSLHFFMKIPKLSICTIFRDEADYLTEFLDCVTPYCDDLVLVDTGSVDSSQSMIQSYGLSCHSFPWVDDFSLARNYSLSHAKGDWILQLDCDERVRPEDFLKLRHFITHESCDAAFVKIINTADKNWKSDPVVFSKQQGLRLFRNHKGYQYQNPIHENLAPSIEAAHGVILVSDIVIWHLGYADGLSQKKLKRNQELIHKHWNQGLRTPSLVFYKAMLDFDSSEKAPALLLECMEMEGSLGSLRARAAARLLCWCLIYSGSGYKNYSCQRLQEMAMEHAPDRGLVYLSMARDSFDKRQLQQAQKLFLLAEANMGNPDRKLFLKEILDSLGTIAALLGNTKEATAWFERYARDIGRDWICVLNLMRLRVADRDFFGAVWLLRQDPAQIAGMPKSARASIRQLLNALGDTVKFEDGVTARSLETQWLEYWDS